MSNNSSAFPAFDFTQNRPPEPEFSSQSSREWDQDFAMHSNVFRKVSLNIFVSNELKHTELDIMVSFIVCMALFIILHIDGSN